jgi:hypothetical protein
LKNYGTNILSSVDIYYQVNDGTISSMPWSGSLDPGNAIDMTLSQVNVEEGYNTITVYTVNPNGLADSDPTNDPFTEAFGSGTTLLESTIVFDVAPVRFSWVLLDHAGQPLAFGGPYNNVAAYSTVEEDICIPQEGCYDFVIYESGNWGLCCQFGDGSYTLTHVSSGTVLASGAEVGTLGSTKFCLPIQPCGAEGSFDISSLSAQNGNISSTTITLPAESNRPAFTIAGLDQKINGNPSQRWIDLVSVSYTNGSGESIDYQTYTGALHCPLQVAPPLSSQLPLQVPLQVPPALTWQSPVHMPPISVPWQVPSQAAVPSSSQLPVHLPSQVAPTSSSHLPSQEP